MKWNSNYHCLTGMFGLTTKHTGYFLWCASQVMQADRKCNCMAVKQQIRLNVGMFTIVLVATGSEGQNMLLTYSASKLHRSKSYQVAIKSSLTSIIVKFKMKNIQFTKQLSWGPCILCTVGNKMKQLLWLKCSMIWEKPFAHDWSIWQYQATTTMVTAKWLQLPDRVSNSSE